MTLRSTACSAPERHAFEAVVHPAVHGSTAIQLPSRDKDAPVVVIRGEVDVMTVPELRSLIGSCLERGASDLVVDLADVVFIGAQGLSLLLDAHKRLRPRGGALSVCGASPFVARLMKTAGLEELLAR